MNSHNHCTDYRVSRTYSIWRSMKQRCSNPNDPAFYNYGARGIKVCEQWERFENFLADMGEAPDGLTLDRKNNNEGYSKDNCKWSDRFEQNRNSRNSKLNLEQAVDICCRLITTKDSRRKIAAEYGISHVNVIRIGTRDIWPEAMAIACNSIAQRLKLQPLQLA